MTILHGYGYGDPDLHQDYTEKYGVSPSFVLSRDTFEAYGLGGRNLDVQAAYTCSMAVGSWVEMGLVEKWDLGRIPNVTYRFADGLLGEQPEDIREYFVPYDFGALFVTYNYDQVPESDIRDFDIFTNPTYAGRVSLPDDTEDAFALAFLATGVTDLNAVTETEIEAAVAWLEEVHPNLHSYWDDEDVLVDQLVAGDVLATWAWNGIGSYAREFDGAIRHAESADGGMARWTCGFVKIKSDDGEDDLLYDYMNAVLADNSGPVMAYWSVGLANEYVMDEYFDGDMKSELGMFEQEGRVLHQLSVSADLYLRLRDEFARIRDSSFHGRAKTPPSYPRNSHADRGHDLQSADL